MNNNYVLLSSEPTSTLSLKDNCGNYNNKRLSPNQWLRTAIKDMNYWIKYPNSSLVKCLPVDATFELEIKPLQFKLIAASSGGSVANV